MDTLIASSWQYFYQPVQQCSNTALICDPRFDRKQNKQLLMFGSYKQQLVVLSSFVDAYLLIVSAFCQTANCIGSFGRI